VLVVDDDFGTREYLSFFLASRGYLVDCLDRGDQVVSRLQGTERPELLILDILMPRTGGLEILQQIERLDRRVPSIVLSAIGQVSTVVKAMRLGASDYLMKPFKDEELELAIKGALAGEGLNTNGRHANENMDHQDLISASPAIAHVKDVARRIADTDFPVLILGESGVGKEVLAKFIHAQSKRRSRPFVKVNCAALPDDLLESELFGYEAGAFTGAMRDKMGKFELAHRGCLLLDEIAEMSPHLQAKLLHVLQDGEFSRLGATRPVRVDTRVLASTNKNLEDAVAKGEFRADLYYRLNVIKIDIPPLRERPEDIVLLCQQFVADYRAANSSPSDIPPRLLDAFCRYSWPGNVRQLQNAVKRYLVLPEIDAVLAELREPSPSSNQSPTQNDNVSLKELSAQAAEQAEKELIFRALVARNWNRKQAAKDLNICYKSLLNKLHRWDIPGRAKSDLVCDRKA
jgi:two-component system response regulator AtoC